MDLWPCHACPRPRLKFPRHGLEPLAQPPSRHTIITIVVSDRLQDLPCIIRVIAERKHCFERLQRRRCITQSHSASETVKRLHLLDRVTLYRRTQSLSNNSKKIYKYFSTQQLIDFISANTVTASEVFDRSRLVCRVVIDVHVRILAPAFHDTSNELLKGLLLFGRIERPYSVIGQVCISLLTTQNRHIPVAGSPRLPIPPSPTLLR